MVGVGSGAFFTAFAAELAVAGAALPDLGWRFGEPSTLLEGAGPTDCERSIWNEKTILLVWD